ncbi:hypothetical protein Mapa_003958 [Marchantia paleacea]|nr:hypothetical protein Mapa_003958 [Marchantia paleacea]
MSSVTLGGILATKTRVIFLVGGFMSSFGVATFTSNMRPLRVCSVETAFSASSLNLKVTYPKPRERPVARSFMTIMSSSSPYFDMYCRSPSVSTSQGMPRTTSFLDPRDMVHVHRSCIGNNPCQDCTHDGLSKILVRILSLSLSLSICLHVKRLSRREMQVQ